MFYSFTKKGTFLRFLRVIVVIRYFVLLLIVGVADVSAKEAVLLDIGHYVSGKQGTGARSPEMRHGERIEESSFWYQNVKCMYETITKAGYRCIVTNRGMQPSVDWSQGTPILHFNRPDTYDKSGKPVRYASRYSPTRIGAGMVSADYAISQRVVCAVFLHHNSSGSVWKRVYQSSVFYNPGVGNALAECIVNRLNAQVLGSAEGRMFNNGAPCRSLPRTDKELGGAGWLNACADARIPAVIIEAAMLNNPYHAKFLADTNNARSFALAVAQGVLDFLRTRKS